MQTPFETYLEEINETPLLTAKQEKELAHRIAQGDHEARDHMTRANLRLVVSIARKFGASGLDMSDLISEGNLGLMRAVEKFDPAMNTRFSTYGTYWIEQFIKRAILNTRGTIRIPTYLHELIAKFKRAADRLRDKYDRSPTYEEVARYLKLPKKKLQHIREALSLARIQDNEDEDASERARGIFAAARTQEEAPIEHLVHEEMLMQMRTLLEHADAREATILRRRFGLEGQEPKTLKEVGRELGITRERVRQIEWEALLKLRQAMAS